MAQYKREIASGEKYWKRCRMKIEAVKNWRKNFWNGDQTWDRMYKRYMGFHWTQGQLDAFFGMSSDNPRLHATVNLTGSDILNYRAFVFNQKPFFIVNPRNEEDDTAARIKQGLINTEWNDKRCQQQLKRAGIDWLSIGHCILKTGINLTEKMAYTDNPKTQGRINYDDYIEEEAVYLKRISPFLFYYDPEAPDPSDLSTARWCFEVIIKPKQDVIDDRRYSSKIRQAIKEGRYKLEPVSSYWMSIDSKAYSIYNFDKGSDEYASDADLVVLYEWWDKKFNKYCVFAGGVDEPLIDDDTWPYSETGDQSNRASTLRGFPYHKADFIPIPNQCYGVGIPFWTEDDQDQINRNRTAENEHLRRSAWMGLVRKNSMEPSEKKKLIAGGPGMLVEIDDPNTSYKPAPPVTIPFDFYKMEEIYKGDMKELNGSNSLVRGEGLQARSSAYEAKALVQYHTTKIDSFVDEINTLVLECAYDLLDLMIAYYKKERAVKIVGVDSEYWETVKMQSLSLNGEYDLEMDSTAAEDKDPQMEAQKWQNAFDKIMPMLPQIEQMLATRVDLKTGQPSPTSFDVGEFLKMYFDKTLGVKDIGRFFPLGLVHNPPLEAVTGQDVAAQQGGQPAPPNPTNQLQAEGVQPQSNVLGQLFGGQNGGENNGGGQQ